MWRHYWVPSVVVIFLVLLLYAYHRTRFRSGDAGGLMPDKIAAEEEQTLYLTPGGRYTAADIRANGNLTASQRFRGFRAHHNFRPRVGDRLCPITRTKANPACSWVIGGRTYEFCCPPCVDEFVRLAKEEPDQVLEPDAYVKR